MNDKKDWLYEWKKMMCRQMKEDGPVCSDEHGTIINVSCDCTGCPYA